MLPSRGFTFFWRGCADQYLSLYLGPAHLHFGAFKKYTKYTHLGECSIAGCF